MLSYVIDTLQGGECVCQSVGVAFSHHITNSKATALSRKFSWSIASVPKFLEAAYFSTEHLEPTSTLTLRQLPEKNSLKIRFTYSLHGTPYARLGYARLLAKALHGVRLTEPTLA
ncbi:unnamed protein product [Brassica oleracea]